MVHHKMAHQINRGTELAELGSTGPRAPRGADWSRSEKGVPSSEGSAAEAARESQGARGPPRGGLATEACRAAAPRTSSETSIG